MKTFSKVIFLTLAASASADTIWAKLATRGDIEETSLYDAMELEEFDAHGDGESNELIYGTKKDKDDDKKDDKKKDKDDKKKDEDDKEKDNEDRDESSSSSKSRKDPTRKPTKKPTGRSPSSSSSSKSTKRPTRKPSSSSSSSRSDKNRNSRSCRSVDKEEVSILSSNGKYYRFKIMRKDGGQCVDKNDDLYEYGRFDKVKDFSDCADACVKDVPSSLLDNFRGYDWDCDKERCLCLYDRGTLDSRNGGNFDSTNRDEDGKGDVKSTTKKSDYFCAKLDKVDLASNEFSNDTGNYGAEVRTGLRG